MKSFFWAVLICLINTVAAVITARIGLKKDSKNFSRIIFGSFVIRYFLVSAAVLFVLLFVNINKLVFGLTFLISTFILIISEILYLNNRADLLKTQNKTTKQD
ncbi:MAG: hypothetical protein A2X61_04295 [Ignavibacteria bacterium GWB2_35_12]|nr:MAG: hypothetical protein A2X63_03465 [Ignavibacteria bacterium GWA2_35_8]OGU38899.1 MAG: hypothetical protein A2X61_04295 [Ignavibacteria bacterium GWB2_35_12]OGU85924.1 MAG: hypothetical protein A2220_05005 [Ignavibacteria bacterium RIFOXYA2_FULL_35_10]OGV20353.1 MAG: hypothetical protein A2475_12070 [Ignavibacteria bacterium RIFOXYC2_FULL_35_21]